MGAPAEEHQQLLALRAEIGKMAADIDAAKKEIFALQPSAGGRHIHEASHQLSAVVQCTEDATNDILNAADELQAMAAALPAAEGERLQGIVSRVYEACNFQDLTTQRIGKVTKVLTYIDERITRLVGLFGHENDSGPPPAAPAGDARPDSHLMNGPSDRAPKQADIDALFGSAKTGS
jgi:chemotaxis protein CheZ